MSRLSTSSSLSMVSMATSIESADSGDRLERLFPNHWEDENEMDKGLKILKRKKASNLRLRKVNNVYDKILQGRIRFLDSSLKQVNKELKKETNVLKEEIKEFSPEDVELPQLKQASTPPKSASSHNFANSRSTSRNSDFSDRSFGKSREKVCQTCYVDPTNSSGRCRHFPCFLPMTYNSLGIFPKPQTYSRVSNYGTLMKRCRDLRPPTSVRRQSIEDQRQTETPEDTSRAPRISTKERLRGLKHLVREMRERNEQTKPRDWAINYGDPLPRRVLLNPVKV